MEDCPRSYSMYPSELYAKQNEDGEEGLKNGTKRKNSLEDPEVMIRHHL